MMIKREISVFQNREKMTENGEFSVFRKNAENGENPVFQNRENGEIFRSTKNGKRLLKKGNFISPFLKRPLRRTS